MTNKEKSIELVKQFQSCINNNVSIDAAVMACLIEMAEWKEKQMIEKACEWLQKHAEEFMPASYSLQKYQTNGLLYYFKKAMKE